MNNMLRYEIMHECSDYKLADNEVTVKNVYNDALLFSHVRPWLEAGRKLKVS